MSQSERDLVAILNEKAQPNTLDVSGTVEVYSQADKVSVEEAEPQGFNPNVLIIDVRVQREGGPMKGTMRAYSYRKTGGVSRYTHVTARYEDGTEKTVDVETQG